MSLLFISILRYCHNQNRPGSTSRLLRVSSPTSPISDGGHILSPQLSPLSPHVCTCGWAGLHLWVGRTQSLTRNTLVVKVFDPFIPLSFPLLAALFPLLAALPFHLSVRYWPSLILCDYSQIWLELWYCTFLILKYCSNTAKLSTDSNSI